MSDDLQFGEVETAQPERAVRPDKNRHYAVLALGEPAAKELPIFVDLDVMRDIEHHAVSDTTVELGGVLLGAACHDDEGRPFVIVTDSLRAQHYEATKGSFKFTHDTWAAIGRERDQFPPELQMVGWYHTHPDWGVFLSGMDLFICNNFFNKPLDIALVVDPCRGDRGMFQWTNGPQPKTQRTGGFYLVASRFRGAELEEFVRYLAGETEMPDVNAPRGSAPNVVHIHGQQPAWQGLAVFAMLALQFCLLALIAWKMVEPQAGKADLKEQVAQLIEQRATEAKAETQRKVLDRVLGELKGAPAGYVSSLEEQLAENKRLQREAADQKELAMTRELERKSIADKSAKDQAAFKSIQEEMSEELTFVKEKRKELEQSLKAAETKLAAYEKPKDEEEKSGVLGRVSLMQWLILGTIGVLFSGAIGAAVLQMKSDGSRRPTAEQSAEQPVDSPQINPEAKSPERSA